MALPKRPPRKKADPDAIDIAVPTLSTNKITRRALAQWKEKVSLAYAGPTTRAWHDAVLKETKKGNREAMKMAAAHYGLLPEKESGPLVTVTQSNNNAAISAASAEGSDDFAAIARRLQERRLGPSVTVIPAIESATKQ